MKTIEKILTGFSFLGILFFILSWQGANILLMGSMGALSMLYLYFGFAFFSQIGFRKIFKKTSYEIVGTNTILKGIFAGVILSLALVSFLFKILDWPGAQTQMYLALLGLLILGGYNFYKYYHTKEENYFFILKRWLWIFPIFIISFSLPKNYLFERKFKDYPTLIEAQKQYLENPSDTILKQKLDEEWLKYKESKAAKPNEATPAE
jgi:hypothetical protein